MNNKFALNSYYSMAVGISGIISSCYFTLLDRIAAGAGLGGNDIGYLVSLYTAGSLILTALGGFIADRFGKGGIARTALLLASLGFMLLFISKPTALVFAGIFLIGSGSGCSETQSSAILTEHNENATKWMNISQIFYCLGALGTPVLVIWYINRRESGHSGLFLLLGILIAAFALLSALPSARRSVPSSSIVTEHVPLNMFSLLKNPSFLLICIMIFLYVGSETVSIAFIKPLLLQRGLSETSAAASISIFWGFMILGRWIGALQKNSRGSAIFAFNAIFVTGVAILLSAQTQPLIYIGVATLGLGCGPVWPMLYVIGGNLNPGRNGAAFAVMSLFSSFGGIVFPVLIGTYPANRETTILLCGVIVAALPVLLLMSRKCSKTALYQGG